MYETISITELHNRAANVRKAGDCDIIDTPEKFFSVQYWEEDLAVFWNGFETTDQAEAEAKVASWKKMGSTMPMRIVVVTGQAGLRHINGKLHDVLDRQGDWDAAPLVAHTQVAPREPAITVSAAMRWNATTHRYEAQVAGQLYSVEEAVFAERFLTACNERYDPVCGASPDDEHHIWRSLTRLTGWDFSGKYPGVASEGGQA